MTATIIMIIASALFAFIFIYIRTTKGGPLGVISKTFASLMFIALAITATLSAKGIEMWMFFIILGGVCGLVGDNLLDLKVVYKESNDLYLNFGMISFAIGHIFYFVSALFFAEFNAIIFIISLLFAIALSTLNMYISSKKLKLTFGRFFIHSAVYSFILTFVCVYTLCFCINGINMILLSIGFVLFLLSDMVLAPMYFGGKEDNKLMCIINHSLYYSAQIIIASAIFFT